MKIRVLACLAMSLLILGSAGCSSSDSGGSTSIAVIESNVQIVMSVVATIIQGLEPFPPAPAIALGVCNDIPDNDQICTDAGSISDCGNGAFTFNNCEASEGSIALAMVGSLQFSKGVEWPTGTRNLDLTANGTTANYMISFDGSDVATVIYSDDIADADCSVDLNPPVFADCAFIP
jgi:hypothetical protein